MLPPAVSQNCTIYHIDLLGRVVNPIKNKSIGFDIYDDGSIYPRF